MSDLTPEETLGARAVQATYAAPPGSANPLMAAWCVPLDDALAAVAAERERIGGALLEAQERACELRAAATDNDRRLNAAVISLGLARDGSRDE